VPDHEPVYLSLGLRTRALSDQEEKVAMIQKMLEMDNQLVVMTTSGWALCDVVLGAGQGSPQLVPHLDEAHFHVDSLISEGVHCGTHAALMLVNLHYGSIDFDVVG
jgi:hypothetical protein